MVVDFNLAAHQKGRKRSVSHVLGHTPRGSKVPRTDELVAKVKENRTRILTDIRKSHKLGKSELPSTLFHEDQLHLTKRLRSIRRKLLARSRFNLEDESEDSDGLDALLRRAVEKPDADDLGDDSPNGGSDSDAEAYAAAATELNFSSGKEAGETEAQKKTKQEVYKEIMQKAKAAKAEASRTRAHQNMLLEKLNGSFEDVVGELQVKPSRRSDEYAKFEAELEMQETLMDRRTPQSKQEEDEFDQLLVELQGGVRGMATDRRKGATELAIERAKRLEEIEAERLQTLRDEFKETASRKRRRSESADDDVESDSSKSESGSAETTPRGNLEAEEANESSEWEDSSEDDEDRFATASTSSDNELAEAEEHSDVSGASGNGFEEEKDLGSDEFFDADEDEE